MKNRVVIIVDGGVVQDVLLNNPDIEVTLIDWDNIKGGDEFTIDNENGYAVSEMDDVELTQLIREAIQESRSRCEQAS